MSNIIWIGSSNYTLGRNGQSIKHIVVHHMDGTLSATDSVFQDTSRNTSAHYGVGQSEIHQYVKEKDTAYHAGNWNENLQSIGIEHEDFASDNFSDAVYASSAALIKDICTRYDLPISRATIHPHNEFVATACPGTLDIDRLINEATKPEGDVPVTPDNAIADQNFVIAYCMQVWGYNPFDPKSIDPGKQAFVGETIREVINAGGSSQEALFLADPLKITSLEAQVTKLQTRVTQLQQQLSVIATKTPVATDTSNTLSPQASNVPFLTKLAHWFKTGKFE